MIAYLTTTEPMVSIISPAKDGAAFGERTIVKKSGREIDDIVKFDDFCRRRAIFELPVADLTVVSHPPTSDGSILEKSAGMRSATGDRAGAGKILHGHRILKRDGRTSVTELTLNSPSPALDGPRLEKSAGMTGAAASLDGLGNARYLNRRRPVLRRPIAELFIFISSPTAHLLIGVDYTGMSLAKKRRPASYAQKLSIIDVLDENGRTAIVPFPIAELTIRSPSPTLDIAFVEESTGKTSPRRYPGRIRYVIDGQRRGVFVCRGLRPDLIVPAITPALDLSVVEDCAALKSACSQVTGVVDFDVYRRG